MATTSTTPGAMREGTIAVMSVGESTVGEPASWPPTSSDSPDMKLLPCTVMVLPPPIGPALGVMLPIAGADANRYWSPDTSGDCPAALPTWTSTAPGCGTLGAATVICVSDWTVTPPAWLEPKLAAVVQRRLEPVTVTVVPPEVGPDEGLTDVTVGVVTLYWNVCVFEEPPAVSTLTGVAPHPAGDCTEICW